VLQEVVVPQDRARAPVHHEGPLAGAVERVVQAGAHGVGPHVRAHRGGRSRVRAARRDGAAAHRIEAVRPGEAQLEDDRLDLGRLGQGAPRPQTAERGGDRLLRREARPAGEHDAGGEAAGEGAHRATRLNVHDGLAAQDAAAGVAVGEAHHRAAAPVDEGGLDGEGVGGAQAERALLAAQRLLGAGEAGGPFGLEAGPGVAWQREGGGGASQREEE
jgi:hypothetical protein